MRVENGERLRQLGAVLSESTDAVILCRTDGVITAWNRGAEQLYGYSEDEVAGRNIEFIVPESFRSECREFRRRCAQGEWVPDFQTRRISKSGRLIDVSVSVTPLCAADGNIDAVATAEREVTESVRAVEALRDSEARVRGILESAFDAIVTIDARGIIESFNPAAQRMFGYSAAEVIGKNVKILMPSPYREQHAGYILRYLRTGNAKVIGIGREVVGLRKDGTCFPVDISVSELLDGESTFIGILRDLTERKQLEAEFLQAQKMEAVGRLAGGIAHDFNNLLMGIIGCCRVAASHLQRGTAVFEQVEEIRGAAERGAALGRQLMSFSRNRAVEPRPIDLVTVVAGIEPILRQLLGEDTQLQVSLAPTGGPIIADPGQIEQVIMNLAVNARHAMPRGGTFSLAVVDIDIGRGHELWSPGIEPGHYVVLSVRDTGAGMTPEVQKKIFEPFFTTKGPGEGTGLGLSTAYGIVKQAGGHITVTSEVGAGTTFQVYFPRNGSELEQPEPIANEEAAAGGAETVLVVEDDRLVRAGLKHELESLGYRVLLAASPDQAVEVFEEHMRSIDLLLTDIVMPGRGGAELAEELGPRKPELKLLFMSAFSAETLVEQGRLGPGHVTLEKPFSTEELASKVRAVLDGVRPG